MTRVLSKANRTFLWGAGQFRISSFRLSSVRWRRFISGIVENFMAIKSLSKRASARRNNILDWDSNPCFLTYDAQIPTINGEEPKF